MFSPRISSPSLRSVLGALAVAGASCLPAALPAQELPIAPSTSFAAGVPSVNRPVTDLFGNRSLFLTTPGTGHWSLFMKPVHPVSPPLFSGPLSRTANPFALFNDTPATANSSFVLGGFNLNAGITHRQGGMAAPLSGFSVGTRASGMDFSLSGGVGSGNVFNSGGFGPATEGFGSRSFSGGTPGGGATPQLSLRLKF